MKAIRKDEIVDPLHSMYVEQYDREKVNHSRRQNYRLSTAGFEELRPTIIETLAEDIISADANIYYKAFIELRKEKNLTIFDEEINKKYEEYCKTYTEDTTEKE